MPVVVLAQETEQATTVAPSQCNTEEHRQFDFWIGDWTVTSDGQLAGTNSIQSIQDGCALQENWRGAGAGGISGTSFNIYDRGNDSWHQTWIDSTGSLLLLDGALLDGKMVLSGTRPSRDGSTLVSHRITWTANEDGSVQQHWESSQDGGRAWSTLFNGLYIKDSDNHETR